MGKGEPVMRNLPVLVAAAVALSSPSPAQERIRSPQYTGESVEECYEWQVDFDAVSCVRRPLAGSAGIMAQIYTLQDGSLRNLTQDPGIAGLTGTPTNVGEEPGIETIPLPPLAPPEPEVADSGVAEMEDPLVGPVDRPKETLVSGAEPSPLLPPVIMIRSRRTEILPIATGHLNRIETPFSDPAAVAATSQGKTLDLQFDQNFIYVSVTSPVTLFIHQRGFPDPAIAVSLVPHRIAPRQVKLTLPPEQLEEVKKNEQSAAETRKPDARAPRSSDANSRGVTRNPPQNSLGQTLAGYIQTFAKGRLPRGFTQISVHGYDPTSFCKRIRGVTYDFLQGAAIASNEYIILRGMVSARQEVELDERDCARDPQTLAVAFSPRTNIGPRQPTDFFVLLRKQNSVIQTGGK